MTTVIDRPRVFRSTIRNRVLAAASGAILVCGLCASGAYAASNDALIDAIQQSTQQRVDIALLKNSDRVLYQEQDYSMPYAPYATYAVLPDRFDLRQVSGNSFVTPVKNQGIWQNCWAFSAVGAAESSIMSSAFADTGAVSPLDLSELHLSTFASTPYAVAGSQFGEGTHPVRITGYEPTEFEDTNDPGDYLMLGGYTYSGVQYFASGMGVALESVAPYYNALQSDHSIYEDPILDETSLYDGWRVDESLRYSQVAPLINGNRLPLPIIHEEGPVGTPGTDPAATVGATTPEADSDSSGTVDDSNNPEPRALVDDKIYLKQELMQGRAVSMAYCADRKYYRDDTCGQYAYESADANHGVLVVGWDDNFPREYFGGDQLPEHNGAWIVKNSWGENFGAAGYFYLSYEDKSIANPLSFEFDTSTYPLGQVTEKIDQYDFMPVGGQSSVYMSGPASSCNVFTATQNQTLQAIGFYTVQSLSDITYEVYKLDESFYDPESDAYQQPDKGTLVAANSEPYNFTFTGYHRVDLDSSVMLSKGDTYAIVITEIDRGAWTDQSYTSYLLQTSQAPNKDSIESRVDMGGFENNYSVGIVNPSESYVRHTDADTGQLIWSDWRDVIDELGTTPDPSIPLYGMDMYDLDNFGIKGIYAPLPTPVDPEPEPTPDPDTPTPGPVDPDPVDPSPVEPDPVTPTPGDADTSDTDSQNAGEGAQSDTSSAVNASTDSQNPLAPTNDATHAVGWITLGLVAVLGAILAIYNVRKQH